jgi:hypothetical protein
MTQEGILNPTPLDGPFGLGEAIKPQGERQVQVEGE